MVFRSTNTHQMHPNHKLQLCRMPRTSSNPKESLPKESPRIWCKSDITSPWLKKSGKYLLQGVVTAKLASIVQSSLRFLFTLGLIFFSKCSLSAQRSWPCCFLFFPSSSLPKARSILLLTVRFLSSQIHHGEDEDSVYYSYYSCNSSSQRAWLYPCSHLFWNQHLQQEVSYPLVWNQTSSEIFQQKNPFRYNSMPQILENRFVFLNLQQLAG